MSLKKVLRKKVRKISQATATLQNNMPDIAPFPTIQKQSLAAGELFNLFTANIIKENVIFTR